MSKVTFRDSDVTHAYEIMKANLNKVAKKTFIKLLPKLRALEAISRDFKDDIAAAASRVQSIPGATEVDDKGNVKLTGKGAKEYSDLTEAIIKRESEIKLPGAKLTQDELEGLPDEMNAALIVLSEIL